VYTTHDRCITEAETAMLGHKINDLVGRWTVSLADSMHSAVDVYLVSGWEAQAASVQVSSYKYTLTS